MKEAELPYYILSWEVCVHLLWHVALHCLLLMSNLKTQTFSNCSWVSLTVMGCVTLLIRLRLTGIFWPEEMMKGRKECLVYSSRPFTAVSWALPLRTRIQQPASVHLSTRIMKDCDENCRAILSSKIIRQLEMFVKSKARICSWDRLLNQVDCKKWQTYHSCAIDGNSPSPTCAFAGFLQAKTTWEDSSVLWICP